MTETTKTSTPSDTYPNDDRDPRGEAAGMEGICDQCLLPSGECGCSGQAAWSLS
jgi:hypothetical protein